MNTNKFNGKITIKSISSKKKKKKKEILKDSRAL